MSTLVNDDVEKNANNENTHTSTLTVEIPIIPISTTSNEHADIIASPPVTVTVAEASKDTTDTAAIVVKSNNSENNNNNNNANLQQDQQQDQQRQQQNTNTTITTTMTISSKDKMDTDPAMANFKVLFVLTQLIGLTMIVLMGCWIGVHMGGLAGTSNPSIEFNWHPLLMTIGLIFLYGNAILVYRGFRSLRKRTLKLCHAAIHVVAFVLTVLALVAVFDSHNLAPKPIANMYSLHSWLGLAAVIMFCLQYVAGFAAFLAPGAKQSVRAALLPIHVYFGLFGFILAIAAALMGITEKAIFSVKDYSNLPSSGVMVNLCGVLYVTFGALVVYLVTNPNYKRKPLPEDTVLLTSAND
uniref:Cytochrome b561 domain-containing protein n=1 Tax=Glossina austeni TaxID=7395 RepID=A0A1A9V910_GLOAU